jgi:hypothetical protein
MAWISTSRHNRELYATCFHLFKHKPDHTPLFASEFPGTRIAGHHVSWTAAAVGFDAELTLRVRTLLGAGNELIVDIRANHTPARDKRDQVRLIEPFLDGTDRSTDQGLFTGITAQRIGPGNSDVEVIAIAVRLIEPDNDRRLISLRDRQLHFKHEGAQDEIARLRDTDQPLDQGMNMVRTSCKPAGSGIGNRSFIPSGPFAVVVDRVIEDKRSCRRGIGIACDGVGSGRAGSMCGRGTGGDRRRGSRCAMCDQGDQASAQEKKHQGHDTDDDANAGTPASRSRRWRRRQIWRWWRWRRLQRVERIGIVLRRVAIGTQARERGLSRLRRWVR